MEFLLRFLPADKRALLELALRLVGNLDSQAERKRVAEYGLQMLDPNSQGGSRITVSEWARFGGKEYLGILSGPNND